MEEWNEICRPENAGQMNRAGKCRTGKYRTGKCRTGKCRTQDWKLEDNFAGLENAGLENAKQKPEDPEMNHANKSVSDDRLLIA